MAYLLDTNILVRRAVVNDPTHRDVMRAMNALMQSRHVACVTAQNLVEYRALATCPVEANMLGFSLERVSADLSDMEDAFVMAAESPGIFPPWRDLVDRYAVIGQQAYDARLVVVMPAHAIPHTFTLNGRHFRRFTEITVVEPGDPASRN